MGRYLRSVRVDAGPAFSEALCAVAGISVNAVADAFEMHLGTLPGGGVAKVEVRFTADPGEHGRTERLLDVAVVHAHLDPADLARPAADVGRLLARLTHDAVASVLTDPDAREHLATVHTRALATLADFRGPLSRAVRDRRTGLVAELSYRYTDRIDVLCRVSGPSADDTREILMFRHPAVLQPLRALVGRPAWSADGVLAVPRRNPTLPREDTGDRWLVDPRTGTTELVLARVEAGQAHGMYDLSRMYRDGHLVLPDPVRARSWLERAAAAGHVPAVRALAEGGPT